MGNLQQGYDSNPSSAVARPQHSRLYPVNSACSCGLYFQDLKSHPELMDADGKCIHPKCGLLKYIHPKYPPLKSMIPPLRAKDAKSPPSIPREDEHQPCKRRIETFYGSKISLETAMEDNTCWNESTVIREGAYGYRTERDICKMVIRYLTDLLQALNLDMEIAEDYQIAGVKPDVMVIKNGFIPAGVIEVKKPQKKGAASPLVSPTVLGELFNQMSLVGCFYGCGPVCGLLTNGNEWLICWLPRDNSIMSSAKQFEIPSTEHLSTPDAALNHSQIPTSPLLGDPNWTHEIDEEGGDDAGEHNLAPETKRELSSTAVLKSGEEGTFEAVCTALLRMSDVALRHTEVASRCVFGIHLRKPFVTWHNVEHQHALERVNKSRFPNSNVQHLYVLEDLGSGKNARCWLACTTSFTSVCVVKFTKKHCTDFQENSAAERALECEHQMWHKVYPAFKQMVRIGRWSGSLALMMPHCNFIPEKDRFSLRHKVRAVMETFRDQGLVHHDIHWNNFGCWLKDKQKQVILFDLESVKQILPGEERWVEDAMESLYPADDAAEIENLGVAVAKELVFALKS